MAEDAGHVIYTTKELIAQVNENVTNGLSHLGERLDSIEAKLERKADRDRLHDLSSAIMAAEGRNLESIVSMDKRLALLETNTVKREGPLVNEMRQNGERLQRLENGISTSIRKAIEENNNQLTSIGDRIFSRRERIAVVAFACVGAVGTLVSVLTLALHVTH